MHFKGSSSPAYMGPEVKAKTTAQPEIMLPLCIQAGSGDAFTYLGRYFASKLSPQPTSRVLWRRNHPVSPLALSCIPRYFLDETLRGILGSTGGWCFQSTIF